MDTQKATDYEEFEAELLRDPEIRREYDALRPKYEIIRRLIERRHELHLSQARLARLVGTKQPAISRLESGDHNATLDTLFKVASALDLDLAISLKVRDTGISSSFRVT